MSGGGLTRKMHIKSRRGGRDGGGEERQLTIQITKENGVLVLKVDVEQLSCYVCISEDTPEGGREGGEGGGGSVEKVRKVGHARRLGKEEGREGGREENTYLRFAFRFSTLLLREPSAGKCAAATTSVL